MNRPEGMSDSEWEEWEAFTAAFPEPNEDLNGHVFQHPMTGGVWVCELIEGLGWCWYPM